ncbi:MAG: hypothetical protein MR030_05595 [Bacteroidales bacterium]|nr:hypothetical protein [Bacteroidales bacterium]
MNILLRTILFFVLPICLCSCNKETEEKIGRIEHSLTVIEKNTANADPVFKLYPTRNMWNFLKLDTRNGKVSIVQFSVEDNKNRFEYALSDVALSNNNIPGRYILQPTDNIYNFIMLDQVTGQTYQVQWSFDETKRFVVPIN